jgi:hypothetical protein
MLDLEQTLKELGSFVGRLTDDKQKSHSEHQAIALIGEGSHNEQNFASDWFDVAIFLILAMQVSQNNFSSNINCRCTAMTRKSVFGFVFKTVK